MKGSVLVDTGPLVALFNTRDFHHDWALRVYNELKPPLHTCDAVLTEVLHLLQPDERSIPFVLSLLERKTIISDFSVQNHAPLLKNLMKKYANMPMDFADACLVRMSEAQSESRVWTLDSDFLVYRRNGRARIPLIYPN